MQPAPQPPAPPPPRLSPSVILRHDRPTPNAVRLAEYLSRAALNREVRY
jgi:hypothetical protein